MAGDIEEFLRRAAQRRAQQQQQSPKPQVRPPQGQRPKPAPPRPVQILDAEIIQEVEIIEPRVLSGSSVAEHVKDHIREGVFDEQLSHLGEEVDRSDDRMEAHLHQVFEHDLGQLGARTSTASDSSLDDDSPGQRPQAAKPTNFLALLQNPASIRQAIILSEILARPSDRW
ncbi:MAG: hypothetical protein O3C40_29595 [Planctomycetota bacterium]|nr:hypothetical protein [Planctomycetota bacterium]